MLPKLFCLALLVSSNLSFALDTKPQRIVTLTPALGELVADLIDHSDKRIVGVSEYTDYPPMLKKVESIGPYSRVNLEKIVSLRPDLVLATKDGNAKDQVVRLRELGLKVLVVSSSHFSEIKESMVDVGAALGVPERGKKMAQQLQVGLDRLQNAVKKQKKIKVVVQVGDQPLVVAGKNTFVDESLSLLGLENAYGKSLKGYPRPSVEDLVNRQPDYIVVMALGEDLTRYQAMAQKWYGFKSLKAAQNKRVKVLKADGLVRPTLRLLEGLSALQKMVAEARS